MNEATLRCDALFCNPCGHCGRRPHLKVRQPGADGRITYLLECPDEDCGASTDPWPTRDEARLAWNSEHV